MKFDEGFKQSEKMLNELEAKIHNEYAQASKEMADKATAYFNRFKSKDLEQRDRYENGEISKKEYTEWRKRQMATGKRYVAMRDTLAKDLTNTDKIAMKMVNQALPDVYALNMNYGTYSIEKDSKINTSFTLYNHAAVERLIKDNPKLLPNPKVDIPKDLRWNQQHIQSAITQGILQGKSIPEIAKNLQSVTGMDERAAIRNARTAMTGAQNAGRLDSMKRAQARGIGVKKGWLATLDHVTRDSHVDLDGEVQELDRAFSNGLMYPGDASGIPAEVYNCRCRLTHEYDKYKTDWSNPANRNVTKLGGMTYVAWKAAHYGKATKIGAKAVNRMANVAIDSAFSEKQREIIEDIIETLVNEYDSPLNTIIKQESMKGSRGLEGGHVSTGVRNDMYLHQVKPEVIIHEFAHTLAIHDEDKFGMADNKEFWKEIRKIRTAYSKDSSYNQQKIISAYASTDIDEFMAEAFAFAQLHKMGYETKYYRIDGLEYANKVLEVVKKYFGR